MRLPDEDRFTKPEGWRTGEFINPNTGHRIHYASVSPDAPCATVVILQGLSEFTEKYFELARDMLARGFAVWTMDWAYQGRSIRMPTHPMRRHSDGFQADIHDLQKLVSDHVIPAAQGQKLVLIGHSMGGHIGLRYLAHHKGLFSGAALSAPMLGIAQIRHIPPFLIDLILSALSPFKTAYMPPGKDWHEEMRAKNGTVFSSDPVRDQLHMAWTRVYPELRIGAPTVGWVYEAIQSCRALQRELEQIEIPVRIGVAARDTVVDNAAIIKAANRLKYADLTMLDGAHHEIFMEQDRIRTRWLDMFDKFMQELDIVEAQ